VRSLGEGIWRLAYLTVL